MFSDEAVKRMEKYPWPGNVKLENIVEGVILTADNYVITEDKLPASIYSETPMGKI